ncbi:MAG TPA: hypothetical protein VMH85_08645 [Terriglobales bacterium]|nr:hypothetical protein [Terriglobales bacterium]
MNSAYTLALNPKNLPNRRSGPEDASAAPPQFSTVLTGLLRHPSRILRLWNWKAAVLSVILRGPIFIGVTIRHGWEASLGAVFAESVFCALTAGFYGAVVQSLRNAEPQWLTVTFLTVVLPAIFQVLEYGLHWIRGTPHLRLAEIVSVVISALSALFNWYAMRRGSLLVGGEGDSFGKDVRRLPGLLVGFLIALPRRLGRPKARKDLCALY